MELDKFIPEKIKIALETLNRMKHRQELIKKVEEIEEKVKSMEPSEYKSTNATGRIQLD